jgi:hypothetical protein
LNVSSIELIDAQEASRFLADGAPWTRVAGGQGGGATMSGVVLRLHLADGETPPSCIAQRTELVGQDSYNGSLRMVDLGGGVIQSGAYWFVFPPDTVDIRVEAYGQTRTFTGVRVLYPWEEETLDSGAPDSGAPDSGAPDSGAPDSGAPDSGL